MELNSDLLGSLRLETRNGCLKVIGEEYSNRSSLSSKQKHAKATKEELLLWGTFGCCEWLVACNQHTFASSSSWVMGRGATTWVRTAKGMSEAPSPIRNRNRRQPRLESWDIRFHCRRQSVLSGAPYHAFVCQERGVELGRILRPLREQT